MGKRRGKKYAEADNVPKDCKSLMCNQYVATFRHYYLNMADIRGKVYNFSWDDGILVQSMAIVKLSHFKKYRTKPRRVFYGTAEGLLQNSRGTQGACMAVL